MGNSYARILVALTAITVVLIVGADIAYTKYLTQGHRYASRIQPLQTHSV